MARDQDACTGLNAAMATESQGGPNTSSTISHPTTRKPGRAIRERGLVFHSKRHKKWHEGQVEEETCKKPLKKYKFSLFVLWDFFKGGGG